jgi:hypothetical protein
VSNSTTLLDTISQSQAQKEVTANALFDAASPATIFGRRASTTTALTWGYYGGSLTIAGTPTQIANGTVTLTASTTNYVEATSAGVVSKNTTGFTAGSIPLYTVVTSSAAVDSYTDHRDLGVAAAAGLAGIGYINIPQNSQSAAYTTVLADQGKHLLHPSADTTARTFTIAANASVAYPLGTAITFVNQNAAGVLTISIASDTMRLAGSGATGSRTLAANGVATALKIATTEWIISGSTGLT